ncbi:TIGR03086 family metal-binding protein [Planomonospora alba]|uniref:TIGR03086 family metal-binding protein n=1 Tax=Planomonospora alba TaxID=161354 RepID=A0ABP6NJE6_9ACTN
MDTFSPDVRTLDLRDLDRRALETAGHLITRVRPEHLAAPTPCTAWNLGELLRHMVSENHGFAAAAADRSTDRSAWDRGELGTDPYRAYQTSAAAVTAAFAAGDAYDRRVEVREFGVFRGRTAMAMHFVDVLVHGWDIAASIGAPYPLDEEAAAGALAIAAGWPDVPGFRGPGAPFGARVPVRAGASATERLLGLLGRSPAWAPPSAPSSAPAC